MKARPDHILFYQPVSPHVNNAKNILHKLFSITIGRTFVSGQSRNARIFFLCVGITYGKRKRLLKVILFEKKALSSLKGLAQYCKYGYIH